MATVTSDFDAVAAFAAERGLTDLQPVGSGLEFVVHRAMHPAEGPVALRVPAGARFQSNANDPHVDTRALLRWEYLITRYLSAYGVAVAEPLALVLGEPDVLMTRYVPDDGTGFSSAEVGVALARLHRVPPPEFPPFSSEELPTHELLPRRIARRWCEIASTVADLPPCPGQRELRELLASRPRGSLVHLDVRAPNLRCVGRSVRALLDWSNALVGDPALELARLSEFARLPENRIDLQGVLHGYGELPDLLHPSFLVYQLDAAVMLAVVFLLESPDDARGADAVQRVLELHGALAPHLP